MVKKVQVTIWRLLYILYKYATRARGSTQDAPPLRGSSAIHGVCGHARARAPRTGVATALLIQRNSNEHRNQDKRRKRNNATNKETKLKERTRGGGGEGGKQKGEKRT